MTKLFRVAEMKGKPSWEPLKILDLGIMHDITAVNDENIKKFRVGNPETSKPEIDCRENVSSVVTAFYISHLF